MNEDFDSIAELHLESFQQAVERLPKRSIDLPDMPPQPLEINIFYDEGLLRHGRVGAFCWAVYEGQKYGCSHAVPWDGVEAVNFDQLLETLVDHFLDSLKTKLSK